MQCAKISGIPWNRDTFYINQKYVQDEILGSSDLAQPAIEITSELPGTDVEVVQSDGSIVFKCGKKGTLEDPECEINAIAMWAKHWRSILWTLHPISIRMIVAFQSHPLLTLKVIRLTSSRMVIECFFGQLKSTWFRCLLYCLKFRSMSSEHELSRHFLVCFPSQLHHFELIIGWTVCYDDLLDNDELDNWMCDDLEIVTVVIKTGWVMILLLCLRVEKTNIICSLLWERRENLIDL